MNQPILATVYIRGALALLLGIGGIAALVYGFRLFRSRHRDASLPQIAFEFGSAKIHAHSTGPVVMATAVGWAMLAGWVCPSLKVSPTETDVANSSVFQVYSFPTQSGLVNAPAVVATGSAAIREAPDLAAGTLRAHLDTAELTATATISGQPAHVSQVNPVTSNGKTFLLTKFESNDATAVVRYVVGAPSKGGKPNELEFFPISVTAVTPKPRS